MSEDSKKAQIEATSGFRAIVFDFDGLILDTESPDFVAWSEVYAEHDRELEFDDWVRNVGLGAKDVRFSPLDSLQAQVLNRLDEEGINARRRQRYLELVHAQQILPGVEAAIAAAKRLDMKLAVASSSDCAWVTGHLLRLNLFHSFDVIRCADHVQHTKPHPELYLAAVNALGVEPHDAVAFEDSSHGVTAAKAAGLYAVAIPNSATHRLPLAHADLRLASLDAMPLETLLATLKKDEQTRINREE